MKKDALFPIKIFISGLLILFLTATSYAQDNGGYIPNIREEILPSPTSKIYARYMGYKPDMSTGSMDISIPLYAATVQNFTLPLKLQYHSNGTRVMENHFPLGYGWILNPGLRITRTVINKADERVNFDVRTNEYNYTYEYLWQLNDKNYPKDASHDIFTIHLPEQNSTFLLEKENGTWNVLIANSSLKITPQFNTYNELNGFSVIDEKGITYKFGGQYTEKDAESGYLTAWMLYQIVLPGKIPSQIDITWNKKVAICNAESITNDYIVIQDQYYESQENPGATGLGFNAFQSTLTYDYLTQEIFLPQLIKMPNQTIEFSYNDYFEDIYMSGFIVKDINGSEVKRCSMTYSNENTTLDSLYISGEGTYNFNYYGGEYMDSRSQDYWGYYNGKINPTLIPSFRVPITSFSPTIYEFAGADRSIDDTAMQNFMLRKVTYPTKGYMEIEYEPHEFNALQVAGILIDGNYVTSLSKGGGVRVKKTVSYSGNGSPEIIRTYKYGVNENGKGVAPDVPDLRWFVNEQYVYHADDAYLYIFNLAYRQLIINGNSSTVSYPTYNPSVWYPVVTEYERDLKTTYYFDYITNGSAILGQQGGEYPPFYIMHYNNLAQKGALLKKKVLFKKYNDNYVPIEKEEYDYTSIGISGHLDVANVTTSRFHSCKESYNGDYSISDSHATPNAYYAGIYWIHLREYLPCKERKTLYQEDDSIVTEKSVDLEYQDNRVLAPRCTIWVNSRGETYSDYLYYPCDPEIGSLLTIPQQAAINTMKSKNRILQPLVYIRKKGNTELLRKVIQYKDFGNDLLLPEKEFYRKNGSNEEERIIYQKYDEKGNLLGTIKDGMTQVVYLWSYGSMYPVVKIEGATYAEVESWLGAATINSLAANTTTVTTALNSIRNTLSGRGVLLTTYTYQPLVGMKSMTAPNGEVTTYEYDSSGRLVNVKDHTNKTAEQYNYHNKNQ